jgi:hypothetical protein
MSLIISISLFINPVYSADDFLSSKVKDISDRKYDIIIVYPQGETCPEQGHQE